MTDQLPARDDFMAVCRSTCAPTTVNNFKLALKILQNYRDRIEGKITPLYLTKFFEHLTASGLRRSSIHEYHSKLKQYFDFCVDRGIWETSPLRAPVLPNTQPRPKPIFASEEYERLKAAALEFRRPWWHDAIVAAWNLGFRVSDIAMLKWNQVDLVARAVSIVPQKQVRFGKVVQVPIMSELQTMLEARWINKEHETYVFYEMSLKLRGRRQMIRTDFAEICQKAEVPFTSIHGLRRSFVSRLANAGFTTEVICSLTGHCAAEVMTYVQIDLSTKHEAMKKLEKAA